MEKELLLGFIQIDNSSQSFQESDTMNLILIFFFQVCLLVC